MNTETTYLLCPNPSCELFLDTTRYCPCEYDCPYESELIKMIICRNCGEIIGLPGGHPSICSVDHNCPDGKTAINFQRMSGKYYLIHERPVGD